MRRIAVWNTAFLGDAVLTLPLIQSLRLRYPDAEIDFYVRGGLAGLFSGHPALHRVFSYDKRGQAKGLVGFARLCDEAAKRKYCLWVSAHSSLRSGAVALASKAPVRVGYVPPHMNRFFYNKTISRCFGQFDEIERLLRLLIPLGDGPMDDWPRLFPEANAVQSAEGFFSRVPYPVLGMHPGSVWGTKRWPARYFAEIGQRALQAGASVVLFAGPGEEDVAREVRDSINENVSATERERLFDLSGALSLTELAAYLARLSCYLTNDSGPMHMAWAQHVPVTAVFGPTVRSLGFFPRGERSTVFETELDCRPCGLHGPAVCPKGHHHCMTSIAPEQVWPDVQAKLWAGASAEM